MTNFRLMSLMIGGGLGSVLISIPYLLYVFGPMEEVVGIWGRFSFYLGILLIGLSIIIGRLGTGTSKLILGVGFLIMTIIQIPPVFLWITFHGNGITDGPSDFTANWMISIPHALLFIVGVYVLKGLLLQQTSNTRTL